MEIFSTASGTVSAFEQWGLEVIHAFQSIQNPLLTNVVLFISDVLGLGMYLFALPILYWCFSEKAGIKLFLAVFFSVAVNTALKVLLAVPRPFQVDSSVYIVAENGFSTPSGHSQIAATFWVLSALLIPSDGTKKRIVLRICIATIMPIIIGLTRIYLGVHYPTDVLFGWVLGIGIALITFYSLIVLKNLFYAQRRQIKTLIFAALTASFIGVIGAFQAGLIFGFGIGYVFILEFGGYNARLGNINQKLIRLATGTLLVAAISYVLMMLLAVFQDMLISLGLIDILLFTSTAFVGFLVTFILPKIFIRTKTALNYDDPFTTVGGEDPDTKGEK